MSTSKLVHAEEICSKQGVLDISDNEIHDEVLLAQQESSPHNEKVQIRDPLAVQSRGRCEEESMKYPVSRGMMDTSTPVSTRSEQPMICHFQQVGLI